MSKLLYIQDLMVFIDVKGVLYYRVGCSVTNAVIGALVSISAVCRLDRHFHLETLATPADGAPCKTHEEIEHIE
jgi:hypothetical protein